MSVDSVISKSQKKRDANALQALGEAFVTLNHKDLNALNLPIPLKEAIVAAKTIKSHGALKRHIQWIGKLMRGADHTAIIASYERLLAQRAAQTQNFHDVENWRKRLLTDENTAALTEFVNQYPKTDVQQLRQCIKKAMNEQIKQVNHGASKALFRLIQVITA